MLSLPLKRKGLAMVFIYDVNEVLYRRDLCMVKKLKKMLAMSIF